MHRIDSATAVTDKHGTGKDGFTEVSQVSGIAPTQLTEEFLDTVQEEIAEVIEQPPQMIAAGTLAKFTNTQFDTAMFNHSRQIIQVSNWTEVAVDTFVGTVLAVAPGDVFEFLAVGASGDVQRTTDGGFTWNQEALDGAPAADVVAAVWSGSLWVVAGAGGLIQSSPDGTTWTARTAAGAYAGTFFGSAWDGSVFCLVGTTGEIQTSADGITWTARTADSAYAGGFQDVHFSGGLFVAVGITGSTIQTSPDGITWTERSTSFPGRTVVKGATKWVVVAPAGPVASSPDAITWSAETALVGVTAIDHSAFGGGMIVVQDTRPAFHVTLDGSQFITVLPEDNGNDVQGIATNGKVWLAPALSGKVWRSLFNAI